MTWRVAGRLCLHDQTEAPAAALLGGCVGVAIEECHTDAAIHVSRLCAYAHMCVHARMRTCAHSVCMHTHLELEGIGLMEEPDTHMHTQHKHTRTTNTHAHTTYISRTTTYLLLLPLLSLLRISCTYIHACALPPPPPPPPAAATARRRW